MGGFSYSFLDPFSPSFSGAAEQINRLMHQLSPNITPVDAAYVRYALERGTKIVAATREGEIVGMGTLAPQIILAGPHGMIHDIIVDASWRRHGIMGTIMNELEEEARRQKFYHLELTSHPSRTEANARYPSLGYERRLT